MRNTNFMSEDADWDLPKPNYSQNQTALFRHQPTFSLVDRPRNFQEKFFKKLSNKNTQDANTQEIMKHAKGTTTLAFRFQGGIMIGVDSRSSMGTFNNSEEVRKIIPITSKIVGTIAGGAADCVFWQERLGMSVRLYELKYKERMTIQSAAKIFSNMMYEHRGRGISAGCMVAGSDLHGTHLYYLDNDGNRVDGNIFSIGSGSTFAYGLLDSNWRWDLTVEEARQLAKTAISEATGIDAASGGICRIMHVDQNGWKYLDEYLHNNQLLWERIKKNAE